MLTEQTFARGLQLINSVCVKQIETDDTINIYHLSLQDLDDDIYLSSIMNLIKTKENIYNPFSPAEIINKARELTNQDMLIEDLFDKLKLDIIKYGYENKPIYPDEIEEAIKKIGGWLKLCNSEEDEIKYIKKDFKKNMPIFINKNTLNFLSNKTTTKNLLK